MKTILVTGGTSGIGYEIVGDLAGKGHRVLFTCRSAATGKSTADLVIRKTNNPQVIPLEVDFAKLSTVGNLVQQIRKTDLVPDILINNAGTWEMVFKETEDGIETNFQVNHLATMLLTLLLLPDMVNRKGSRIVVTSSGAHRRNCLKIEDPEYRHGGYDGIASYSQSKLANLLFTFRLADRLMGVGPTVNAVHPGYVQTALFKNMGERDWQGIPDAGTGARSALFAALNESIGNLTGSYFYQEHIETQLSPVARSAEAQNQMWEISLNYLKPWLPDALEVYR